MIDWRFSIIGAVLLCGAWYFFTVVNGVWSCMGYFGFGDCLWDIL